MKIIRHRNASGVTAYAQLADDGSATALEGDLLSGFRTTGQPVTVGKLLAPIVPTAIFCAGLNYRRHAEETKAPLPQFPVLFMKGPNTAQNPGDPIVLPRWLRSNRVDYECELAVVIGKPCKNVTRDRALEFVLGYTCANDVSA